MQYIAVKIPKAILYLKPEEIHRLVIQDRELFSEALKRGKYITRAEGKQRQYEAKWSAYEGDKLKDI
jgi:hypothetical protein